MAKSFDSLVARTTSLATQQRAAKRTRELLAEMLLSEVRERAGKSQRELAALLGVKQPTLSKLEHQTDIQISTLQRIVEALGGKVEVLAKFPNGTVRVKQFDAPSRRSPVRRTKRTRVASGR